MSKDILKIPKFYFIGISVKTINEGDKAQKDIGDLWNRFYSEEILSKIPNKKNNNILSMYTDYEGDFTKPYTAILGCEVESLDDVPEGMVGKEIDESEYQLFKTINTDPASVVEVWQNIWSSGIKRAYKADFEVYDSSKSKVEIYLSV